MLLTEAAGKVTQRVVGISWKATRAYQHGGKQLPAEVKWECSILGRLVTPPYVGLIDHLLGLKLASRFYHKMQLLSAIVLANRAETKLHRW